MANKETLPWDLIEETLSCVPPESLVRFKTVSKQWNALICKDKTFINKHKMTFQFILATKSKIYSVSISPKIEVRELTSDIPGLESQIVKLIDCNGLLLCVTDKGAVVWNPWLRQARRIEPEVNQPNLEQFYGMGYGNDNGYKTLASTETFWKIHDLSSDAWKDQNDVLKSDGSSSSSEEDGGGCSCLNPSGVSLNGTLYWVASFEKTKYLFLLAFFDFSTEKFHKFCDIPCGENHDHDAIVLRVFRGDRFSLLKQSRLTKKIEVWVTKNKIHKYGGRDVEWMDFMQVSIPNLPDLAPTGFKSPPSYFIDDKRLVVCSCDETGRAWIYVMEDNKLISKVHIDLVVDPRPLHCTFSPSLVSVPQGPREEAELQV